jgi:hypothetical protein
LSKIAFVLIILSTLLVGSCLNILAVVQASMDQPASWVLFPSTAYCTNLGAFTTEAVPVVGNPVWLSGPTAVVVFGVFHNSKMQTIEVSTASIILSGAENETAYVVYSLPQLGNYTVSVFVWSTLGAPVSTSENLPLTCS